MLILDLVLLGPNTSGWVPVDLRGYLVVPWMLVTLVFAAITTPFVYLREPGPKASATIPSEVPATMKMIVLTVPPSTPE